MFCLSALFENEGVFSLWNGQRPVRRLPTRRSRTYSVTTLAISTCALRCCANSIGPGVTIIAVREEDVYAAIGEEGFNRFVAAFYRQVPHDPIVGPMYPKDDMAGAEYRMRTFLIGRFGGPPAYIEERGHPRLRMRFLFFLFFLVLCVCWF